MHAPPPKPPPLALPPATPPNPPPVSGPLPVVVLLLQAAIALPVAIAARNNVTQAPVRCI
jgi:hypothetical protein